MEPIIFTNSLSYRTGYIDLSPETWETVESGINKTVIMSHEVASPFPLRECIPSWNLICGLHGWGEIFLRGKNSRGWTEWYPMGIWASGDGPVTRSSFKGMEDDRGVVKTDTLCFKEDIDVLQMKLILSEIRRGGQPLFKGAALTWSGEKPGVTGGFPDLPKENLPRVSVDSLPAHSQMIYSDGGNGWCSPTSVSMVLGYWRGRAVCPEAAVREAVGGVYDPVYGGTGNWSFNAAWAGSLGYRASLCRFARFSQAVPFLEAGIPLVLSIAFDREKDRPLEGAPMESTAGHLTVLRGFDGRGRALMHEPAALTNEEVPRTYDGAELEKRWLESSGGLCYIIYPEGVTPPYARRS